LQQFDISSTLQERYLQIHLKGIAARIVSRIAQWADEQPLDHIHRYGAPVEE